MLLHQQILSLFALLTLVSSSALTIVLKPEEESCYYILTQKAKTSVGYYFAVQSGGDFDIDYTIKSPQGKIISSEERQRQGDWAFNAEEIGEYEFCFSNLFSKVSEKVVDFEIHLESDFRAELPNTGTQHVEVEGIINSVEHIETTLNSVSKTLQYYRTRNNRNQFTVKSTESRIFYFSIYEVILIVGMAIAQVYLVQYLFTGSRKTLV
ncbi:hypothetical protein WICPIJ_008892 [Wickerhamomyces pijperi]|uniref:GOLD domain-containing protein n=1 Tax=Wickerhamomyces pijperi TaxID=599730 RepID=A0A9P8PTS1_WICPI|nr:hypothetical protein WICPIJ_008892 [Wickerhamomyces pijperi]